MKDEIFIVFAGAQRSGSGPSVWSLFSKVSILVVFRRKTQVLRILSRRNESYVFPRAPVRSFRVFGVFSGARASCKWPLGSCFPSVFAFIRFLSVFLESWE